MENQNKLTDVILRLFDVEAVKFGSFTLKSGIQSPVYFDFRVVVSFPQLMRDVSELLYKTIEKANCQYDSICGVPYTALPLATCISADHDKPMLIRRKEAKSYGTKKMIEGRFKTGDVCLIIEDVVTSGSSVFETVQTLNNEGIKVTDAIVLLDRQQGGKYMLADNNVNLHSVIDIDNLLSVLETAGKITNETVTKVTDFIQANNTFNPESDAKRKQSEENGSAAKKCKKVLTYKERSEKCTHFIARTLFEIMESKKTNLCLSADVTTAKELLQLAETVGPHICLLKTHIDIIQDFTIDLTTSLAAIAETHNFLIFEDRKFADIGNTVKNQYSGGVYRISDWAHIVNAHALPGPGIVHGLKEIGCEKRTACLLLAEMSSKDNLFTPEYTKATVSMAEVHKDFVIGFISTSQVSSDPAFIHMTPGVQLESGGDSLGQQYLTPSEVISNRGSDIIIVGRGITKSEDPVKTAQQYQEAGYSAYQSML